MRNLRLLLTAATIAVGLCRPALAETPDSDPRAVAIADQVMKSLGGKERWDALVGLRWTFQGAVGDTLRPGRRHAWNKHTGWHRVDGTSRQGQPFCFIDQLDRGEGMAWMDGTSIEGDSLGKLMRRAKSLWTNDTYWMLMPYKLRDPGVRLGYDGEVREGDTTYDRITLAFDHVGETPGDRYWVYVNRSNHRVEKWEHLLQGASPPPVSWSWEGWEQHDGLWFPTIHRRGSNTIYTRDVETVSAFPAETFRTP